MTQLNIMTHFYDRQLRPEDDSQSERPRKISRPSTGGPSPSSSSSALWRTGSAPRADRQESNTSSNQVNLGAQYRNSAQPVGVQGRLQQRPVTANGRSDNSQSQGMSLSSLLSGGNAVPTMGEKSMGGMSNQYQQSAGSFTGQQQQQQQQLQRQQLQRQQQQDDGQHLRAGNRQSSNIPSQTGNQQGNSSQVTPPSFGAGPGTVSSNTGAVGRPLTPSTLFVQNAQQSQYFPRQQQVRMLCILYLQRYSILS